MGKSTHCSLDMVLRRENGVQKFPKTPTSRLQIYCGTIMPANRINQIMVGLELRIKI